MRQGTFQKQGKYSRAGSIHQSVVTILSSLPQPHERAEQTAELTNIILNMIVTDVLTEYGG